MAWHAFEQDKAFVTEALRSGDFDYVEVIAKVVETEFFRSLLGEGVLYHQQRFGLFSIYEYQELLLGLREGARRKVLGKTRKLRRVQLRPPERPWRPH